MKIIKSLLVLSLLTISGAAFASPGRVGKDGCHTDKKTGEHHCHETAEKAEKSDKKAEKKAKKATEEVKK